MEFTTEEKQLLKISLTSKIAYYLRLRDEDAKYPKAKEYCQEKIDILVGIERKLFGS